MIFSTGKTLFFVLQLATIAFVATDIYVPSMPAMQAYFKTSPEFVQHSISIYLLALGISQFFYGICSDRFGRKPVILIGLLIGCAGSFFCVLASSIHMLLIGRLIQGAGLGFSVSVGRSIVPDLYSDKELTKMASYVAMSIPMVLMMSPLLGGYIQVYFGWRANFIVLLIYSFLLMLLVYWYFPETNKHAGKHPLHPKTILKHYRILLTSPLFLGYTFCFSAAIAGVVAYMTASPFLLQTLVGLTPVEYGWTLLSITASGIVGSYLNVKLRNHLSLFNVINVGAVGMLCCGASLVLYGLYYPTHFYSIVLPMMIYAVVSRLTTTNSHLEGSKPFRQIMGTASTVFGGSQLFLGSLVSSLIAILPETSQVPLGLVLTALSLFSILSIQLTRLNKGTIENF
jgi:DHA1 family 2-module integral membrane pump EmrD-like MFS transporter